MLQGPSEHLLNNNRTLRAGSEPGITEDLRRSSVNKALESSRAWALPCLQLLAAPALHAPLPLCSHPSQNAPLSIPHDILMIIEKFKTTKRSHK